MSLLCLLRISLGQYCLQKCSQRWGGLEKLQKGGGFGGLSLPTVSYFNTPKKKRPHKKSFHVDGDLRPNLVVPIFSVITKKPYGTYFSRVDHGKATTICEICSKLTLETPKRGQWRRSGVFINFKQIPYIPLLFPLLTLNKYMITY